MPGLRYDATKHIDIGNAVVSLGSVSGRVRDGPEISVALAFVTYFEQGLPVRTEEYLNPDEALEAVGLSE